MKILVVGSGGREHALAWKLAAGTWPRRPLCARQRRHRPDVAHRAGRRRRTCRACSTSRAAKAVDLTVVGPELPLDRGIVDLFSSRRAANLWPDASAARLECSKVFAKGFMATGFRPPAIALAPAPPKRERSSPAASSGCPIVIKADGLAAGKGVVVAGRRGGRGAIAARWRIGSSVRPAIAVVLEECLEGPKSRSSPCATAACRDDRIGPGSQAHLRRRSGPEHRRHGGLRTEPADRSMRSPIASCARSSSR